MTNNVHPPLTQSDSYILSSLLFGWGLKINISHSVSRVRNPGPFVLCPAMVVTGSCD